MFLFQRCLSVLLFLQELNHYRLVIKLDDFNIHCSCLFAKESIKNFRDHYHSAYQSGLNLKRLEKFRQCEDSSKCDITQILFPCNSIIV